MRSRPLLTTLSAAVLSLALAGCGTPPWEEGKTAEAPASSAAATPTPSPTPQVAEVTNDLAKGSAKRKLGAGGVDISVTYWSTLDLGKWTPAATKPLNLSMTAAFGDGSEQNIFLSSMTVAADVTGTEGPLTPPEPLTDQAPVTPGYLVKSPSSYVKVFNLPAVDPAATSVTLNVTYELLAQAAPKSKQYLRQSTSDTLTIPLAAV